MLMSSSSMDRLIREALSTSRQRNLTVDRMVSFGSRLCKNLADRIPA
jgi:hypothetical protein